MIALFDTLYQMTPIQRKFETIAVGQLIETFFNQPTHHDAAIQASVINAWNQVMSPTILSKTQRCFVRNNHLFVCLTSASLRQELQLSQSTILARLKAKMESQQLEKITFI